MEKTVHGKANMGTMKGDAGAPVPAGQRGASKVGQITESYSNTDVFERDRIGGSAVNGKIEGMNSHMRELLDDPGFEADGQWIRKNGTPYGEGAMFNQLPPGMDISDQAYALINNMPLRMYQGGVTYPGDTPWPVRDVEE